MVEVTETGFIVMHQSAVKFKLITSCSYANKDIMCSFTSRAGLKRLMTVVRQKQKTSDGFYLEPKIKV